MATRRSGRLGSAGRGPLNAPACGLGARSGARAAEIGLVSLRRTEECAARAFVEPRRARKRLSRVQLSGLWRGGSAARGAAVSLASTSACWRVLAGTFALAVEAVAAGVLAEVDELLRGGAVGGDALGAAGGLGAEVGGVVGGLDALGEGLVVGVLGLGLALLGGLALDEGAEALDEASVAVKRINKSLV